MRMGVLTSWMIAPISGMRYDLWIRKHSKNKEYRE
jgi:hypothetical protein